MKVTGRDITRLAKAVHASHYHACAALKAGNPARAIPWHVVESEWARASTKERADYRWEAGQVLRTLAGLSGGDPHA